MGQPMVPKDPKALLTRDQTADALTEAGFPTSPATLATKATRGGGPPYCKFGPRALYEWGTSLQWARDRLRDPVRNTSENDASRAKLVSAGELLVASSRQPFVDAARVPENPAAVFEIKHGKRRPQAQGEPSKVLRRARKTTPSPATDTAIAMDERQKQKMSEAGAAKIPPPQRAANLPANIGSLERIEGQSLDDGLNIPPFLRRIRSEDSQ
jgi:hypothetical protein